MNKLICIIILAFSVNGFSQEPITISGKVIDSETKSPLPFATISVQNTSYGVVANDLGAFDLIVTQGEAISISTLGYLPKTLDIKSIVDSKKQVFELVNQPMMLDEVTVSAENKFLNGEAILKLAVKNQKKNFPNQDYA